MTFYPKFHILSIFDHIGWLLCISLSRDANSASLYGHDTDILHCITTMECQKQCFGQGHVNPETFHHARGAINPWCCSSCLNTTAAPTTIIKFEYLN